MNDELKRGIAILLTITGVIILVSSSQWIIGTLLVALGFILLLQIKDGTVRNRKRRSKFTKTMDFKGTSKENTPLL